ncbi:DUF3999 family protein [Paenibacillus piscarius]|uniref:DUF3999 family protein n=1 Tax=Paenibacillus piscarius TaxID=1089681 RepID=UPI001EE8DFF5|nr:DUF3999 family protein [Paenibacillus piscarius]
MRRQRQTGKRARAAVLLAVMVGGLLPGLPAPPGHYASAASGIAASGTADKADSGEWKFSRAVTAAEPAEYYALYLDEAVYRSAADDLRDLRVKDNTGADVPYYLERGVEAVEERSTSYSSQLVHQAVQGQDTLLDYQIKPLAEHMDIQGNKLVLELPAESFLKHVEVWGGYDGVAWERVAQGELYGTDGLRADSIVLEHSYKFSYYRLVVKNNAEGLKFPGLTLLDSGSEERIMPFLRHKTAEAEITQNGNRTEIVITNRDRLKIAKVMLGSSGTFLRRAELFDAAGSKLPVAGSGELYRLDFKNTRIARTEIQPLTPSSAAELRMVIYNLDDAPIPVNSLSIEYLVDRLVFAGGAQADKAPYSLIYGNRQAAAPQYDIINFKERIDGEQPAAAALGEQTAIPARAAEDPRGAGGWFRGPLLFNLMMLAVSLLLVLIVARRLGRTK